MNRPSRPQKAAAADARRWLPIKFVLAFCRLCNYNVFTLNGKGEF